VLNIKVVSHRDTETQIIDLPQRLRNTDKRFTKEAQKHGKKIRHRDTETQSIIREKLD
jgi:hypothetical protein